MRVQTSILATAAVAFAAAAVNIELDEGGGIELNEGERVAAEEAIKKATPPKTVGFWNFDDMVPDAKGMPKGWWVGIWGDRKVNYGNDVGADGEGRSMLVDVRSIVGGELQIFSPGWELIQDCYYKISFKIRGFDHPGYVGLQVREAAGTWRSPLGGVGVRPTNEWKEYTFGGKSGISMPPGAFGILVSTGTAGCFAIDDVKVEEYLANPFPPPQKAAPVPFVAGNLIPRGSFESDADPFWCYQFISGEPDDLLFEPGYGRAREGHAGAHCLRYAGKKKPDGKLSGGGSVMSLPIPVAEGKIYSFSVWARTSAEWTRFSINGSEGGNGFQFGAAATLSKINGWTNLKCVTKPVPASVRSVILRLDFQNGEEVFVDSAFFGADEKRPESFTPATPYELDLGLETKNPGIDPRIVTWGEKLPLVVAAWPAKNAEKGKKIAATLKVTGYPAKAGREERLELVAGEAKSIAFDPQLNGVLRVELIPDDPTLAKPLEVIMGRLPKPRATGAKGRFGMHMRISPQILAYARAIGITWQRIHDCSPITNMGFGNPKRDEYRWADAQVDALRDYGFSILGMPDYPPAWLMHEEWFEDEKAKAAAAAKEEAIKIPKAGEEALDEDDPLNALRDRQKEADKKLLRYRKILYDNAAFRTWCRELAKHYKGRIDHYELWNEPYMEYFFKGGSGDYVELFHEGAKGIREGNPDAKVLGWCNEFTTPETYAGLVKKYPVKDKPDYNSMHYYFTGVPGSGEFGIERIVANYAKAFGEHLGSELWDTEGNMGGNSSFFKSRYHENGCEIQAAFGVRGWSETFFGGVDRLFIFGMFNTDGCDRNGGILNAIDYDRSLNVWGAATATTAYFIDAMKPHPEIASPKGIKLRVFSGDGRVSAVVFDDCLERGRPTFDATGLPDGWLATDAMGNDLRAFPSYRLGLVPCLATATDVEPAAFAAKIAACMK